MEKKAIGFANGMGVQFPGSSALPSGYIRRIRDKKAHAITEICNVVTLLRSYTQGCVVTHTKTGPRSRSRVCRSSNLFLQTVALLEAIYSSAAVDQLLTAREERVALAADFDLQLALGGAGKEGLAAGTAHDRFAVRRMNIFLHVLSLLRRVMHYRRLLYHTAEKKQAKFFGFRNFF